MNCICSRKVEVLPNAENVNDRCLVASWVCHGRTPLLRAVIYNDWATVDALLQLGASCSTASCCGSTVLHYIAEKRPEFYGHIAELVSAGADINAAARYERTALRVLLQTWHRSEFGVAVLNALITAGSLITQQDIAISLRHGAAAIAAVLVSAIARWQGRDSLRRAWVTVVVRTM